MPFETKEITSYSRALLVFDLKQALDEIYGQDSLTLLAARVDSGSPVFLPTFRFTVKRKLDDPITYSLWRKVVPPYPANNERIGPPQNASQNGISFSGGIMYVRGQPWWYWYSSWWPPGYTYSPTTPPTNWDADNGGSQFFYNAFRPFDGEVAFLVYPHETWFPPGDYFGWIEIWKLGDGSVPSTPADMVVDGVIRILPRPQVDLAGN